MKYLPGTALIISAILLCSNIRGTNCIINGRNRTTGEAKYDVAVVGITLCSGAILDDTHILTSAQCFYSDKLNTTEKMRIVAGSDNSNSTATNFVSRAYMLASFVNDRTKDDIGVLELSTSLAIDQNRDKLEKLALPSAGSRYVGQSYLAVGYGSSKLRNLTIAGTLRIIPYGPGQLLVGNATVLSNDDCVKAYGGDMSNRMCVAVIEDPTRTTFQGYCAGDNGSPIVINGSVVGIVTQVNDCNNNEHPAVATDVTSYLSFVQKAVSNNVTSDMLVYNYQN